MLAKSYDGSEGEDVPPLPDELRDRIADQYGQATTAPSKATAEKFNVFAAMARFFPTPELQRIAALVTLLLVATVLIKTIPSNSNDLVRGHGDAPPPITCVLYGLDPAEQAAVHASGLGAEALHSATTPAELQIALDTDGPRIVIDGTQDKILGYPSGKSTPSIEETLPRDPHDLTTKIAEIITRLTQGP